MNENLYKAMGLLVQAPGAANARKTIGREAHTLDEFVRHEQPERPLFFATRQAGMGEMIMGERLPAFGPALAGGSFSFARSKTAPVLSTMLYRV